MQCMHNRQIFYILISLKSAPTFIAMQIYKCNVDFEFDELSHNLIMNC